MNWKEKQEQQKKEAKSQSGKSDFVCIHPGCKEKLSYIRYVFTDYCNKHQNKKQ